MVILRYKKLKTGNYSLYLDISSTDQLGNSARYTTFLKLYTQKDWFGKDRIDATDRSTVFNALEIRKQTELELLAKTQGVKLRKEIKQSGKSFLNHLKEYQKNRVDSRSTGFMYNLLNYVKNKDVLFDDVTQNWLSGYTSYLQALGLKPNTVHSYLKDLRAIWNKALTNELVFTNPFKHFQIPKAQETEITALTVEDIQKLVNTPFAQNPNIRLAFLFSCFTGLRISDIYQLVWEEIIPKNNRYYLKLIPQKTSTTTAIELNVPLCEAAMDVLEMVEGKRLGRVFTNLPSMAHANTLLKWWVATAKIKKNVYFHVGRHTYATLAVTFGMDIYTVSKLLGHTSVNTTGIYAKVVDEKKQEEIDKLPVW